MNDQSPPKSTAIKPVDPVTSLPVIEQIAQSFGLNAAHFAYTFRMVAMPQPHSDPEFVSCCLVAQQHGLNPLTKEIYFMKTKSGMIQAIVSVDGWMKKCNEHRAFDGMEFHDEHTDKGELVSTTCTIYRNDRKHPIKVTEYLDECRAGGPVWKTHPRRMLRHRALTQCARYAFGFAGIMDRDEFEQWQTVEGMKDVTPARTIAADPGDIPEVPADDDSSGITDIPTDEIDPPLTDEQADALIEKIRDDLAVCASPADREEVVSSYEGILDRMSDAKRRQAEAVIEGRKK